MVPRGFAYRKPALKKGIPHCNKNYNENKLSFQKTFVIQCDTYLRVNCA